MQRSFFWQLFRHGPAMNEEIEHRKYCEEIIDFPEIEHIRKTPVGRLPYGLQKRVELGRALAMQPDASPARRTDAAQHEPRGEE